MVKASGKFKALAKEEKLAALSPMPGKKRMTLVGWDDGGRWITG